MWPAQSSGAYSGWRLFSARAWRYRAAITTAGRPLRWYLLAMTLASLVPLLVFTGAVIWYNVTLQYKARRRSMLSTVQPLSLAVDREWGAVQATLDTLAASEYLDTGDFQPFYALCTRVAASRPGAWVVLFAASGQQVINTLRPFGTPLPNVFTESEPRSPPRPGELWRASPATVRRAFETAQPVYSDLFIGLVSQHPTLSIDVPVLRHGRVVYVLTMALSPEVFTRLLQEQSHPDDTLSLILDRQGMIIARSQEAERFDGWPASPELFASTAGGDWGWGRARAWDQVPAYHAYTRSPVTGWTTVVSVQEASINGPIRQSLYFWTGGAILFLSLGVGLALFMARQITVPITALVQSLDLVRRGQRFVMPQAAVQEVRDLNTTLAVTADAIRQRAVERERTEVERQRLAEASQRAEHFALLGRLAAGVSHEIRNPLGVIYLHADMLEEELRQIPQQHQERLRPTLNEIKTHLTRIDDLVQDYLSLVRVTTSQRAPHDLGTFVEGFTKELQADLAAHGVTLRLEGLAQLGMVALHANTFRRALLNLVHNAMDAMPHGGGLTFCGRQSQDAGQVALDLRDTGTGLHAEQLRRIFEPLYTTKPGGTGLGLYLVREIVAAHGGEITVQSAVGHGTTFTITLPRAATP